MNWMLRKAMGATFQTGAGAAALAGADGGGAAAAPGAGTAPVAGAGEGAGAAGATGAAGAGAAAGAANDVTWLGADAPPELKGYVANKGWKDPRELLVGYQNLEKLVGEKRLAVPKDENDVDGHNRLYEALGRPKSPAEYKLPVPEQGSDPTLVKAAGDTFHALGLNTKQAHGIAKMWNEYAANSAKAAEERYQVDSAQAMQKLEATWGGAFKERTETASRALRQFGLTADHADKLERSLGTEFFMDFMWRVGHALGEHGGAAGLEGGAPGMGALTPDQAKAEIARLKGDREWAKAYANGDAEKKKRMEVLHKWAFPGA